jgi:hypothetical protein
VANPAQARLLRNPHVGGFVFPGHPVVYINVCSRTFRQADAGDTFALHVLAAEVAHELVHAAGSGERDAYLAQMTTFEAFIQSGRIDGERGRQYLDLTRRVAERVTTKERTR